MHFDSSYGGAAPAGKAHINPPSPSVRMAHAIKVHVK